MEKGFFGIKKEVTVWLILLSLVPIMLLSVINYTYQYNAFKEEALKKVKTVLEIKTGQIEEYINHSLNSLEHLSKMPLIKKEFLNYDRYFLENKKPNMIINGSSIFLEETLKQDFFYDVFFVNTGGDIIYELRSNEEYLGKNINDAQFKNGVLLRLFSELTTTLSSKISTFEYLEKTDDERFAFIGTPIFENGSMAGIIMARIDFKKIYEILSTTPSLGKTGELGAARLNGKGEVVPVNTLKSDPTILKRNIVFTDKNLPIYKATHKEKGVGDVTDYSGKNVIAAWGYVPTLKWGLVAKIYKEEIFEPIENFKSYSIIIFLITSVGIFIASYIVSRHIVEPIEKLAKNVKNYIQNGSVANFDIEENNEVGVLAKNFNEMSISIKEYQERLTEYSHKLEEKVEERTKELELANQKMRDYIDIIDKHVMTFRLDKNGLIKNISQAFCATSGYSKAELVGKKYSALRHENNPQEVCERAQEALEKGMIFEGEVINKKKDGSKYIVQTVISPVFDENNNIMGYTSIAEDITDKKEIEQLSITDPLTKLYNRAKLDGELDELILFANRYNESFCIISADIDLFKMVNDTYGHDIGDEVLKDIADIFRKSIRKTDIAGRWGGEEFLIILPRTGKQGAFELAQKIRVAIENHEFKKVGKKTTSFGISIFEPSDTKETLLKRADEALYRSKQNGRNMVSVG